MGQKVNAVGMRIGVNRDWESKWFASRKGEYSAFLLEDIAIREHLNKELKDGGVSHIEIARTKTEKGHRADVTVYAAKAGVIIGQDGANIQKLEKGLKKICKNEVKIRVADVANPDLDATLIAKWIASELENRASYRSTMKKAIQRMRKAGAKGCRTLCSGRLAGAEIARQDGYKEGVVPLHTLRADIDFAHVQAHTAYGDIGVKVWVCRSLNKAADEAKEAEASREAKGDNK